MELKKDHRVVKPSDLELEFPEPDVPLVQGVGEPCTWLECMRENAAQTHFYFKHYGPEPLPPPIEEPFVWDETLEIKSRP